MTSQDSNQSEGHDGNKPKLLPANLARQTQWEMYAIKEEDPQKADAKVGSSSQQNRPSTPVFDDPDKNDKEGEMIYNRMQAEIKDLDSEDDQV